MTPPFNALPTAIFFDWDGTLVDSLSLLEHGHNIVLESFGKPLLEKGAFAPYLGQPREDVYLALYGEADTLEAQKRFEAFLIENHKDMLQTMDSADSLLKTIDGMNIPMGVVSNKRGKFVNPEIDHLGWRKYFHVTVGAGEAEADKPSEKPLLLGVKRANIEPQMNRIWYVGDTVFDFECAKGAGSPLIYIHPDGQTPDTFADHPVKTFANLAQFRDFLLAID